MKSCLIYSYQNLATLPFKFQAFFHSSTTDLLLLPVCCLEIGFIDSNGLKTFGYFLSFCIFDFLKVQCGSELKVDFKDPLFTLSAFLKNVQVFSQE